MEPAAQERVQQSSEVNSKVDGRLYSFANVYAPLALSSPRICVEGTEPLGAYYPCFQAPLTLPFGARPRAPRNHTLQPRTAGAWHRRRERLPMAEQRGGCVHACKKSVRLASVFCRVSTPLTLPEAGLPAVVHGDVLHHDRLLAARELVEHGRRAVLLGNSIDVVQPSRGDHGGVVDRGHLYCQ